MVCIARERFGSTLGKAGFSFVDGYQLEVASGMRMGLVSSSPLGPGTPFCTELCGTCACCHGLCGFMHLLALLCVEGLVS